MGIRAVMVEVPVSNRSTNPGEALLTEADGNATKAVRLSIQIKKLSVGAGRLIGDNEVLLVLDAGDSLALLRSSKELFAGLETRVNCLLGDSTMGPASDNPAAAREIIDGEITSLAASTILTTAAPPPPVAGCNGLVMKARNFKPLVVVVEEEDEELEFPQESRIRHAASKAVTVSKALFNLGLRRAFRNNNLDARKRIITERNTLPAAS
jgi:hypothetical protein